MRIRHLLFLFFPALLLALVAVGFRIFQYNQLEQLTITTKVDQSNIQIPIFPNDIIDGEKKAPITIVAFEDLGCEGCAQQDILLTELDERHPGMIKVIWKFVPVNSIPFPTSRAHDLAYCAYKQNKFDAFKNLAFVNQQSLSQATLNLIVEQSQLNTDELDSCLATGEASALQQLNDELGQALQIQAVPAMFIDNTQIQIPSTVAGWEELLGL